MRAGPEIELFVAASKRLHTAMAGKRAGGAQAVLSSARELAGVITGELLSPVAAMTLKALGGTEDQADGLLAAIVDLIDAEVTGRDSGPEGGTKRGHPPLCLSANSPVRGPGRATRPAPPTEVREGIG